MWQQIKMIHFSNLLHAHKLLCALQPQCGWRRGKIRYHIDYSDICVIADALKSQLLIPTAQTNSLIIHINFLNADTVHMSIHVHSKQRFHRRWQTIKNGRLHFIAASSMSALLQQQ